MKRIIMLVLIGVTAFTLFPLSSYAADYPYFGPQGQDDFLWYGDSTYPKDETQGIELQVDGTSISFQAFIGQVTMNPDIVDERGIVRFYLLANNRIVDYFDPVWDNTTHMWKNNYWLRFALADWNIGSNVYFRIVGVSSNGSIEIGEEFIRYVVAWSNQSETYKLKPLPVTDADTHGWLAKIYDLLEELKDMLSSKLDKIDASIKKIYEIPPETQAKFDSALANLQSKLPTEQVKKQAEQMEQIVKDSANRIENTPQKVKFGEINWMGVITTSALDFTEFMTLIEKVRKIVEITLWCEFFYFIILILRPRLTV